MAVVALWAVVLILLLATTGHFNKPWVCSVDNEELEGWKSVDGRTMYMIESDGDRASVWRCKNSNLYNHKKSIQSVVGNYFIWTSLLQIWLLVCNKSRATAACVCVCTHTRSDLNMGIQECIFAHTHWLGPNHLRMQKYSQTLLVWAERLGRPVNEVPFLGLMPEQYYQHRPAIWVIHSLMYTQACMD